MADVVVMGCGLHPFGRWPDKSTSEMGRVAIEQALSDANVSFKDIQVAYTGRVYSGMGAGLSVVNGCNEGHAFTWFTSGSPSST